MSHVLVVGGTGMLAGLCGRLADDGHVVSVVGRDPSRLTLATARHDRLAPVRVDYEHLVDLEVMLADAREARGPIDVAVCWIRSWAPASLLCVADAVAAGGRVVRAVGSSSAPDSDAAADELRARPSLAYQEVLLGAVREQGRLRWLTHPEICDGVYDALRSGRDRSLVGEEPRS